LNFELWHFIDYGSPTPREFGYMGLKGKLDLMVFTGVDPVCPHCRPYEASEETYSGYGQRKKWEWARIKK
jgi:hypothetical protein